MRNPQLLAFSFSALISLTGCDKPTPEQAAEPPAVGVIQAIEEKVNPFLEFVGKIRAFETVELRARVTGFLEARDFQEGGNVEEGQRLFRIEPEQYQANLDQAEAQLAADEASLTKAQVDKARYEELLKANNVSKQKVDEAVANVLMAEAAVQQAKAAISKTKLDLGYAEIKAPVSGRIDLARYDVGNLLGPDSGVLATIHKLDPIRVTFTISETWLLELAKADVAAKRAGTIEYEKQSTHRPLIKFPDGTLYDQAGDFDFIDNKVDEKTGTVLVRAVFPNPDKLLLPGQFVTVVVERKEQKAGVLIPQAAVLTDQAGHYALLVNDQEEVEIRRIRTGQRFGSRWLVEEGLTPGERIILYGVQKVRPGIRVKAELTEAPPEPTASAPSAAEQPEESADKTAASETQATAVVEEPAMPTRDQSATPEKTGTSTEESTAPVAQDTQ